MPDIKNPAFRNGKPDFYLEYFPIVRILLRDYMNPAGISNCKNWKWNQKN